MRTAVCDLCNELKHSVSENDLCADCERDLYGGEVDEMNDDSDCFHDEDMGAR